MSENRSENSKRSSNHALDLNSLSSLSFGPDWTDDAKSSSSKSAAPKKQGGQQPKKDFSRAEPRRDRRSGQRRTESAGSGASRGGDFQGSKRSVRPAPKLAAVEVALYPQDDVFDALVKRLRASARTYQLFEIAQLILEKADRYVLVVANKQAAGAASPQPLYYSVPAHLPFESEDAAIDFVVANYLEQFFELQTVEMAAPSGHFQMINKCPFTDTLIGPPNYHKYSHFLKQHYEAKVTGLSFDAYQAKVVGDKSQESIDAWLESMKTATQYRVKEPQAGEPEVLEDLSAVRQFLIKFRKSSVVASDQRIRFAGRDIEKLPKSPLQAAIVDYVARQVQFPLDTANNIRGRLRRHHFTVYKKGAKGISYVCAVKRKFRDQATVLTDSIGQLVAFLEQHPNTSASQLPKLYLGIDTERQSPKSLAVSDSDIEAAKNSEQVAAGEAPDDGAASDPVTASTEAKSVLELDPAAQQKLNQLMRDLRWLITEGYVSEYGDGRLFIPSPQPAPKPKPSQPKEAKAAGAEATKDDATAEGAVSETPAQPDSTGASPS